MGAEGCFLGFIDALESAPGLSYYIPGSDEHGPGFNRESGGGARGVASKNGQGHMCVQRGAFPIAHDLCVCICVPPKMAVGLF